MLFTTLLLVLFPIVADASARKTLKNSETNSPADVSFQNFNFTKRPLNFYIVANGKHVVVLNQSVDDGAVDKPDYRISRPPFSIKKKGCIVLLHNETGTSLDWHRGYPSLIQMLAASGHTTLAVELSKPFKSDSIAENVALVRDVVQKENLAEERCVLISSGAGSRILLDYWQEAGGVTDGIILIEQSGPVSNVIIGKLNANAKRGKETPILDVHLEKNGIEPFNAFNSSHVKSVVIAPKVDSTAQLIVSFLDFIHPR